MTITNEDLPKEIESRIDSANYDMELTQRHVALEFVHGDRPYYNVTKMHAALGGDVTKDTVRSRMQELYEREILNRERINNGNIYWIKSPDSEWPVPPDVEVEPERDELTVGEWREKSYVRVAAVSILLAVIATAIILLGAFEAGGYYQLPFSTENILALGLASAIFSYFGLFVSVLLWVFSCQTRMISNCQILCNSNCGYRIYDMRRSIQNSSPPCSVI